MNSSEIILDNKQKHRRLSEDIQKKIGIWYEDLLGTYFEVIPLDILNEIKKYKSVYTIERVYGYMGFGKNELTACPKCLLEIDLEGGYNFGKGNTGNGTSVEQNDRKRVILCAKCRNCFVTTEVERDDPWAVHEVKYIEKVGDILINKHYVSKALLYKKDNKITLVGNVIYCERVTDNMDELMYLV